MNFREFEIISRFDIVAATRKTMIQMYADKPLANTKSNEKHFRNQRICERYENGESLSELAKAYNVSPQRVHQIISRKDK